jgi:ABC-type multidrug transport system permease subunit
MGRALLVTIRETRAFLHDTGELAFSLLLPVAIFALMYGAFGGESMFHGTAYVVNQDVDGAYSARLIERLDELDNLDVSLLSWSAASAKLRRSDVLLVVCIPEDFSARLISGWPTQLVFRQRGNGGDEGQIVASLVREIADEISQEIQIERQVQRALVGKGIGQEKIQTTVQKLLDREREFPIVGVSEETIGTGIDPVYQFLPGIVTMFVLFSITLNARAIVEERRKGTLERLLTTRLRVGELFTGKFLASVSRGLLQTLILLALAYIVFQVFTPVSFIQAVAIVLFFAAAGSALGLVIASIVRTEDAATWIAVFFTMAMVMISGTFFPIPEDSILYPISKLSINTHANVALKTVIAEGGSLGDVGLELTILAGVGVVGLILSRMLFRVVPGSSR